MQTLSNWKNKAEEGKLAGVDSYNPKHKALIDENNKLRKQLKNSPNGARHP